MRAVIRSAHLCFAATVTPDGRPNVSPKGTIRVWDDTHLFFLDIASPGTRANLAHAPWLELNVVDQISRRGYRFAGRATLHFPESTIYADGVRRVYGETLPADPPAAVVLLAIERAAPLLSPAYWRGDDETAIRAAWRDRRAALDREFEAHLAQVAPVRVEVGTSRHCRVTLTRAVPSMLTPSATTAPSNDSTTISNALAAYYVAHDLPADGGATDPVFHVRIGPFSVPLPNPPGRRRAVVFHDVNHLVTGYNTTFSDGEVVIAGFEVGAGCGPYWIVWYINLSMMALGIVFRPRDVFASFVRGRRSASIYRHGTDPATLSRMSVAEVRTLLELDRQPEPVGGADRAAFAVWGAVATVVLVGPLLAVIAAGWAMLRLLLR